MDEGVSKSRNMLIVLTDGFMGREFCNAELRWARTYDCNLVGVKEDDSADAVEAAERAFTIGVKRLVIAALENQLFQERLRLARARTDFPGPDALTVAMDMEDFMTGISTEMIKLLNIPLPKGIHDELTAEGYIAFTTVDALFNARLQRLHNKLSDRNIDRS